MKQDGILFMSNRLRNRLLREGEVTMAVRIKDVGGGQEFQLPLFQES
jgi:hypothetical protein